MAKLIKVVAVLKPCPIVLGPGARLIVYVGTFDDGSSRTIRTSYNVYNSVTAAGRGSHGDRFKFSRATGTGVAIGWTDRWNQDTRKWEPKEAR